MGWTRDVFWSSNTFTSAEPGRCSRAHPASASGWCIPPRQPAVFGVVTQPSATGASGRKLYASRKKWLGVLAGSIIFTVGGVLMVGSGNIVGLFPATFFGLCAAVAVATLIRPPT